MNSNPILTLSIVSHGDAEKILQLFASLKSYERDTKRFQIILTDNLGNNLPDFDPSPWNSLHILRNRIPLGLAHNQNNAFKVAQGQWFAILNPDLIFEQPVFDRLLESLHRYRDAIVAPYIVDKTGKIQDSFRALPTFSEIIRRRLPGYNFVALEPDPDGIIRPDWIAGMFLLMISDTYRQLGGMDKRYRLYFEDVDFCTRARLKEMEVLVDTRVRVRHDAHRASRKNLIYLFWHLQSAIRFFTSPIYRDALQKLK